MNNKAKKVIKLNESQLRQVIRESVKNVLEEGYGTMSKADSADIWNFDNSKNPVGYMDSKTGRYISSDDARRWKYPKGYGIANGDLDLIHFLENFHSMKESWYKFSEFKTHNNPLLQLIDKKINQLDILSQRIIQKEKMKLGQQPDSHYFDDDRFSKRNGYVFTNSEPRYDI